jgi:signal transduction histidine kinase
VSLDAREAFRQVDVFAGLGDDCLERLVGCATELRLAPGQELVHEGETVDRFGVLVEGTVVWIRTVGGEEVVMGERSPVTYAGASNLLTGEPSLATGRAVTECVLWAIPGDAFRRLLRDEPSVLQAALRVIAPPRMEAEAVLRQREKLAALGTLSAGLAHELNNPAAAARRSAQELADALEVLQHTVTRFVRSGVEREEAEVLVGLHERALAGAATAGRGALDAADREDALTDALDDRGLEGWRLAPPLAEAGLDAAFVDEMADHAGPALDAAVEWVASSLTARGLAEDLRSATERISSVVGAMKDYSYMDRAELQEVDLNHGIETTLTILGHKTRHGTVRVERDLDPDLPRITAHAGQLNQVWTNLIDNAIDAVEGNGTVRVESRVTGGEIGVAVIDDGPGVPEQIRSRIYDPFFTTKEPGKGTGLGLDIVARIVRQHRGRILLDSRPGATRFDVRLPLA